MAARPLPSASPSSRAEATDPLTKRHVGRADKPAVRRICGLALRRSHLRRLPHEGMASNCQILWIGWGCSRSKGLGAFDELTSL